MKAFKVLSSAPKNPIVTDAGECLSSFLFNDIGCIHFELGKYNLSAHYFMKAIEENDAALNGYPPLDRCKSSSYNYAYSTKNYCCSHEYCVVYVNSFIDYTVFM